jgi:hypothetical protein
VSRSRFPALIRLKIGLRAEIANEAIRDRISSNSTEIENEYDDRSRTIQQISLALGADGIAYASWRTQGMRRKASYEMVF